MKTDSDMNFQNFMQQLVETNATLDFFCDYAKAWNNVNKIDIKLNQLNYLIGKDDIDKAIDDLWAENPKAFDVLEILIAVRKGDKKILTSEGDVIMVDSLFETAEGVKTFVRNSGLSEVFHNKQITNLHDYVFGVEVGLDTNARKNRSGKLMESRVESELLKSGVKFLKEVKSTDFKQLGVLGSDLKRFDFVISTKTTTYLVEVNFYNSGGSKLN